jgi:hypothetical protein
MPVSTVTTRATSVAAARSSSPFLRQLLLCVALTALNFFVVVKFAGVLYQATFGNRFEQIGVTLLFAVLLGSLARTWHVTLFRRPR